MKNLMIEETIEIEASATLIWELLTEPEEIKKWSPFKVAFKNEHALQMGDEMFWKNNDGKTFAKGTVIEMEPGHYIRISMHFAEWEKEADPDALTHIYSVFQKNKIAYLTHSCGDFAKVPGGEKLFDEYMDAISGVPTALEKIKELAEE